MKRYNTSKGATITRIISGRSNVFLVSVNGCQLLVDSGVKRIRHKLISRLNKLGITDLDYLLLTHCHFDHAGNAGFVREQFHAKVILHETEVSRLENGKVILPAGTNPFTKLLVKVAGKAFSSLMKLEACRADVTLSAEMNLIPGNGQLRIIPAPGHSEGSVCLVVDDEIALAGDAVFGILPGSAFPPFADDPVQLVESWKTLLDTGAKLFIPAHGRPLNREILEENYLKFKKRA